MRRPTLRALRVPLALLALAALAAPAAQARSPLHVTRVAGGAVATFGGRPAGGIVFVLDGAAIARDRTPPYRLRLRVLGGLSSHRLAVRTLRSGRLLAVARLRAGGRATAALRLRAAAPPAIDLTTTPGVSAARTALVAWRTAPASGGALACTLDARVLPTCRSPLWLSGLRRGRHTFTVRVRTRAGSAGTSVAFTIAAAGAIAVTDRPAAATPLRSALFGFDTATGGGATTCALDGGAALRCASPYGYAGLRRGPHSVVIRSARGSATIAWTVVAPRRSGAPRVSFVDRPRGGASRAFFSWDSSVAVRTTCTLDGRSAACTSPRILTRLRAGTHRFRVRVTNARGSAQTTFTWTVGGSTVPGTGPSCGSRATGPGTYAHVVWIVMENHGYSDVLDPHNAPYTAGLAAACGSASSFYAERHPSLPNYIAMTSGDTQGITDDADPSSHQLAVPSIFSLVGDWRALEEAMPSSCDLTSSGTYAVRHNPAAYYTGIRSACASRDVALGATPDLRARFTFVTPDLCHDTHDCSVRTGDDWLAGFLPKVFASPQYRAGTTAVFLTWDEDDGGSSNHIATVAITPSVPRGRVATATYSHYSLLRTTEELLGLTPLLGQAAGASSMRAAFNF
jgi:hypothetical protein